ncbi:MAG: hypothetical protein GY868_04825, partial [Deltaproteobacteria bacterium]|nr:hypothetical protein [Deltaproteobacteria bacterium]
ETITTTTTIPDSTTTTVPDFYECPPEAPVDCLNGYCCPEDQPYCGSGLRAGRCYPEPPETCPAVNLLGDNAGALDRLRAFRDSILSTTAAGERLAKRYYAHGSELTELLLQDKALRRQASAVLLRMLPAVTAALDGRGLTLKSEDSRAVDRLCSTISRRASAPLTQALEQLRSALREKRLAAELGLVPAKK